MDLLGSGGTDRLNTIPPVPELLAPAGTLSAALAAYTAGADAVYCGLGRFNAREMGTNFSPDDLSRLSARAKALGKRFYVTLNTLVKETEWREFGETAEQIAALEPDAVILQDIGVISFLRRTFPDLELHASTQMGVHNSAGIETLRGLGLSRVILERQVSLNELSRITAAAPLEVEVFIHGALCCSLSGGCLFSSWMGGWSGNRGRCKQPCRRRFHTQQEAPGKSGFFFSTQDLYTLDLLDDLQRAGVASLKIEGRLKQPDYVYRVVQAYRMVLDAPYEQRSGVLGEARRILSGSFGRRWSHGFATVRDMDELIQYDSLGVSGQLVGSVAEVRRGGFRLKVSRKLHLGDRLRVQADTGDEAPAFTLTSMKDGTRPVTSATEGKSVFVPYDRDVPARGKVYRTGTSVKGMSFDGSTLPLFTKARVFDLTVTVGRQGVTVESGDLRWSYDSPFDEARRHALSTEKLEEEFRRTRRDDIAVGSCRVSVHGNPFVPAAGLKQLRREFWEWFAQRVPDEEIAAPLFTRPDHVSDTRNEYTETVIIGKPPSRGARGNFVQAVPLPTADFDPAKEYILPAFCAELQLDALGKKLSAALASGCRRFRITSLYQLSLLKELTDIDKLILTAAYPLPVANALSVQALKDRGIRRVQGWIELEKSALEALRDASPLALELYRFGRPPLLVTRARISAEGTVSDSRGGGFFISPPDSEGLTFVYPQKPMALPSLSGTADCFDYSNADESEEDTSDFNFSRELI